MKKTNKLAAQLYADRVLPRRSQQRIRGIYLTLLASGVLCLYLDGQAYINMPTEVIVGFLLTISGLYIESLLLLFYHNTFYYSGLSSYTGRGNYIHEDSTYEVNLILNDDVSDITKSFLTSTFGVHIYVRAELKPEAVANWLSSERRKISTSTLGSTGSGIDLRYIVDHITTHDSDFIDFLNSQGIQIEALRGSVDLISRHYHNLKRQERWWSRDLLSKHKSLGQGLDLGSWRTHIPFTEGITADSEDASLDEKIILTNLAEHLQSSRDSNVVFVTTAVSGALSLISKLQFQINSGEALGAINNLFILDINHDAILLEAADTIAVETILRNTLQLALEAGNITVVVKEPKRLIESYAARGVNFVHLLEEFLTSNHLHTILVTTPQEYSYLKNIALDLIKRCHEIALAPLTAEQIISNISEKLHLFETKFNTTVSYEALRSIVHTAVDYQEPTLSMVKKLLESICSQYPNTLITKDMTLEFLAHTLNLPIGPIADTERDRLLNLEADLHQIVVGQNRAIDSLGTALRRARTNLHDHEKPISSFLFLGPSGVGKTETAKALAKIYLADQAGLIRLDMSEFAAEDSLETLIGTTVHAGILHNHLSNHPHGLILLDEFEKAHHTVKQLFLQILDEGECTTTQGSSLNFKRHIIVATSNAGSELITRTKDKRQALPVLDADVINYIIKNKILSPELIGRFSEVIIFEPLSITDKETITHRLIYELTKKTKDKGFGLEVSATTITALTKIEDANIFGARSIKHAIEHHLEDAIATAIIKGEVKPGDTIHINQSIIPT